MQEFIKMTSKAYRAYRRSDKYEDSFREAADSLAVAIVYYLPNGILKYLWGALERTRAECEAKNKASAMESIEKLIAEINAKK